VRGEATGTRPPDRRCRIEPGGLRALGGGRGRGPCTVRPMNRPVVLRRIARAEFDDAADWYEEQRAGRGAAFTAAVRQVLVEIGARPEAHPEVYGEIREALVSRYPYAVYDRPEPGQVTALAVFHTSRD